MLLRLCYKNSIINVFLIIIIENPQHFTREGDDLTCVWTMNFLFFIFLFLYKPIKGN